VIQDKDVSSKSSKVAIILVDDVAPKSAMTNGTLIANHNDARKRTAEQAQEGAGCDA